MHDTRNHIAPGIGPDILPEITIRSLLTVCLIVPCLVQQLLLTSISAAETPQRPNVLFILADDLGWRDLSVEGSTFYESPNIDRIANSGMRFTQGYAGCQVCSPSRATIMLGKNPARHGITDWIGAAEGTNWKRNTKLLPATYVHALPAEDTSLAESFKEAG
ncbi:MAG: sulfatase-like hydrolase/transferase, partial [Alphaproteobacteria bacterium]|nr:sulfatase-like hydrolase/transferase [Alphaproteobacteria bacterium]